MKNDFKEVKSKVNILSEIEKITGLTAKKQGESYNFESCPFCGHKDCFKVSKQLFHCFSCDTKGDIFTFYEKYYGINNYEALIKLASTINYPISNPTKSVQQTIKDDIVNYYHINLLENKKALNYQIKIRKHSKNVLEKMKVGFTTGNLHNYLNSKGYTETEQLETGLVTKKDGVIRDYYYKGQFIYPHKCLNGEYGNFTSKTQNKKGSIKIKNEFKHDECLFYNMQVINNHNDIILVEGENDLLSVIDAGMPNVIATNGQLSSDQIKFIRTYVENGKIKKIFTAFDNDDSGINKYLPKIREAIKDKCFVDRLSTYLGDNVTLKSILFPQKYKDIDDCLKDSDEPALLIENLINSAKRYLMPLTDHIELYKKKINEWNESNDQKIKTNNDFIGHICADWFKDNAKYFVEHESNKCNIFYDNQIFEISNNIPFNAMIYKTSGQNASNNGFKIIRQVIENIAFLTGKKVNTPGWIKTDRQNSIIYFNLNNDKNEIIKISTNKIELIKNGSNDEQVLLNSSPQFKPVHYIDTVTIEESMKLIKTLIYDNLACSYSERFFIICMMIITFFVEFIQARGITKFSGNAESGKSTAARLFSVTLFGVPYVATGSTASDYSEATKSPVMILDNLENANIDKSKKEFLLIAGTGGTKRKRKNGTDTENTYETILTQVIVTAIEPFNDTETIQRTNEIFFSEKYRNESFVETDVFDEIIEKRDIILSGLVKLIAFKLLPDFKSKRKSNMQYISKTYGKHAKKRLNELYATLMITLSEITNYIQHEEYKDVEYTTAKMTDAVFFDWINIQDQRARSTELHTNEIVNYLETLFTEYSYKDKEVFQNDYPGLMVYDKILSHEEKQIKGIAFKITTRSLLNAFDLLAKTRGKKHNFRTPKVLSSRLRNSIPILKNANWYLSRNIDRDASNGYYHELIKVIDHNASVIDEF